ncbi:PEP/pyruvate-binding domain-containing protein [Candidatus Omnitrophota bacterium]
MKTSFSSGLPSLDSLLQGIMAGDNIVWQVDDLNDFRPLAEKFCVNAQAEGKKLIYFRFADHEPFVPDTVDAETFTLHPHEGFEQFITEIFTVIEKYGKEVYYLFDCLSGLSVDWYSDRMLGNFFMLTCPYLFRFDTITYFALLRNAHSSYAIQAIHNTAQVVLDIYRSNDKSYILPLKVWKRFSPTMYMLHSWEEESFKPVTRSGVVSEIFSNIPQSWLDFNIARQDMWTQTFMRAQEEYECLMKNEGVSEDFTSVKKQLIKMIISRDEGLFDLCNTYFNISDLISIGQRMIGTGLIGGKSVGMLLARAILQKADEKWQKLLETHDSFFVGSDVFYTYLIENDCWWERHRMKNSDTLFDDAKRIYEKLLRGGFSNDILEQFKAMLNYFGQSPIIVRSSSLLEDAYGNSFSGKYESVFCPNQGTPEERLGDFIEAVRTVYASTMSNDALSYRVHRGLLHRDEQMALLVQRVSGDFYKNLYFPQVAGVGYSFNPFVWNNSIDPSDGVLRLVFGLGTRAVERHDDDYTRVVALSAPLLRPEMNYDAVRRSTQKVIDVLDLEHNKLIGHDFEQVATIADELPLHIFASREKEIETRARALKRNDIFSWMLTFEHLLTKTSFVGNMREMLRILEDAYKKPVDIEFSANYVNDEEYRINLLQCRPFQYVEKTKKVEQPKDIKHENILLKTCGPIIGQSMGEMIDRVVYVIPSEYGKMTMSDRYLVARFIGKLTHVKKGQTKKIMLIGPGRWGTRMPALGIPVSFNEIKSVSALCEIVSMHEGLTPDISLGTHFFNDLVEMDILYMGVFPQKKNYIVNEELIRKFPNALTKIDNTAQSLEHAIHVVDTSFYKGDTTIGIHVNTVKQEGVLFLSDKKKEDDRSSNTN